MLFIKFTHLSFLLCAVQLTFGNTERGQQIYSQICVNCHGPNLDGGIGPNLIDSYWKNGDSFDSIYRSIAKGITGTEMIAYELVYPEEDLSSLTAFIVDKQEGNRETLRSTYPRDYFQGKRLHPDLFDSIESTSQKRLPENFYYVKRMFDGILRGQSKLYISSPGKYRFNTGGPGRTSIWVNGNEVLYRNDKQDKSTGINLDFVLPAGVHDLEIIHEEPTSHSMRFYARLQKLNGKHWMLTGKSLEGSVPKVIRSGQEAKVIRKWIDDLPPRTLLLLLPNKVLLAYDSASGKIIKGWESAFLNQTPSLDSRSQKQSEIKGTELPDVAKTILEGKQFNLLHYETAGDSVKIATLVDGKQKNFEISPEGKNSYKLTF
ncbi:MAG: cytochrome c [Opitutales bacterium]|nr:cytochrome c [Opitutales bacterium]